MQRKTARLLIIKQRKDSAGINNDTQKFTDSTRLLKYALLCIDDYLLWNWVIVFCKHTVSNSCKRKSQYARKYVYTYERIIVSMQGNTLYVHAYNPYYVLREWESKYGLWNNF